jgi:hypothetical protein
MLVAKQSYFQVCGSGIPSLHRMGIRGFAVTEMLWTEIRYVKLR